ncbi:pseudouridine synthase [Planoprotostelium fungivorum]|uniref:Pseudouridine synthase n=1 Tax=Planoprotostelium fungivorum TaxID=1890364 RepID=A0A2P6NAV3_9EUKA|nr:pseudouridine synthase [Planoprotostelium fungivorum]
MALETWTVDTNQIPLRLRKYMSLHTFLSNKQIRDAWMSGSLEVVTPEGSQEPPLEDLIGLRSIVFPDSDVILLNKQPILPIPPQERPKDVFILHKPAGYESSVGESEEETKTVSHWLKDLPAGCVPVDVETSGLLLLTNDHDLNHSVRKSGNTVDKKIDQDDASVRRLLEGIPLHDGIAKALSVSILSSITLTRRVKTERGIHGGYRDIERECTVLSLRIKEGRKHIVRKMAKGAGLKLLHLHRHSIGDVMCPKQEGSVIRLDTIDIERLWERSGGRGQVDESRVKALRKIVHRTRERGTYYVRLEEWFRDKGVPLRSDTNTIDATSSSYSFSID